MKKRKTLYILILAGVLLTGFTVASFVAAENVPLEQKQKIKDDTDSSNVIDGILITTREQREAEEQIIKEQLLKGNTSCVSLVSTEPFTEEDRAALDEKFKQQSEEGKRIQSLFTEGVEIVEHYQPGALEKDIHQPDDVDRNTLSAMADVLSKYDVTAHEEAIIKKCLAEKLCIVLGSDPLYDTIVNLLQE